MAEQISLQSALSEHFHASLTEPLATTATIEGIQVMGFADTAALIDMSLGGVLELVRAWLHSANVLPPKEDVLTWVGEAFDQFVATRPPLAGHPVLTRIARQGLLTLVASLYDAI